MSDLQAFLDRPRATGAVAIAAYGPSVPYEGPERRQHAAAIQPWLLATFDEIDYGIVLLGAQDQVVYGNHAANAELGSGHPLQLLGRELQARSRVDAIVLRDALSAARQRGLRKLLTMGEGLNRASVAVVPLSASAVGPDACRTLLLLGKRRVCEALSVQGFARSHQLTDAETRVLVALYNGRVPTEAASELGVAISTVRTQIHSIRMKTGAGSIGELVRQVAVLPPLVSVLRAPQAV